MDTTLAIKPTIYKLRIALSDLERNYYDTLNLTVALHPSETIERMVARVMAFCLNAEDDLSFTKGLSAVEEPDIWRRSLDEQILCWIDVGEPAVDRIKKASRQAQTVKIYTFNSKSEVWWQQSQHKVSLFDVSIVQFDWSQIQVLSKMVDRTVDWSVTITGQSAYVASDRGEVELTWQSLQGE